MSDSSSGNRNHLLRLWAWPLLLFGVMLASAAVGVSRNADLGPLYWGLGAFVLALGFARFAQARARRRFAQLLLEPSPDPLLTYTRSMYSNVRTPHAELLLASALATQRAMYGQFGRALDELDQRDWSDGPAMYQAGMLHARALVHYLSRDDVAAGLRAAQEAETLAQMPRIAPGAETALRASQRYVDIGRVLCEGATSQLLAALEQNASTEKLPLDHLIGLWARALAHTSLGHDTQAAALRAEIARLAPHCEPLQRMGVHEQAPPGEVAARVLLQRHEQAPPGEVAARAAQDPGRRCALHPDAIAEVCCVRCANFACAQCARAVSESASICAACTARYRELRERNLTAERRMRAVGLVAQIWAISFGALMCLPIVVSAVMGQFQWPMLVSLAFFSVILTMTWRTGRTIRALRSGWRSELLWIALPLLLVFPLGSLFGASLLWQLRRAPFDAQNAQEYQQAVRVTPELEAPSLWPLALTAYIALCFNVKVGLWLLIESITVG